MTTNYPSDPLTMAGSTPVDETDKDAVILSLRQQVAALQDAHQNYYASMDCARRQHLHTRFPDMGLPARFVHERILQHHELDNKPRLNTSSYVNVVQEPEEQAVALLGLSVNLADGSVYPASVRLHDTVVNMIAQLWNCPPPSDPEANYSGAGTVGSTEACLLGGLALKFRWRKWYQQKHGMTPAQVLGVVPNVVMTTCFQAAWEKFFRYFDVEPRFIKPSLANKMRIDPAQIPALCDDQTMAVIGVLGNHYNGAYDPIWDMNDVVEQINQERGYQIAIHVDAASGGFVAPFQDNVPPFDFRLKNVLSISASGHKFGESSCGTGWLVFRQREDLAEHIAVSVTYLGGKSDSMTLNFSRPATSVYVQYYKFLRMGLAGYRQKVSQQLTVAQYLRDALKSQHYHGQPRFEILDAAEEAASLPVVGARLNPHLRFRYTDIDLQHAMAEYHWYVSGYALSFENYADGGHLDTLCHDEDPHAKMFRIVVKSNLTMYLAEDLVQRLEQVLPLLDEAKGQFKSLKAMVSAVRGAHNIMEKGHAAC